MVDNQYLDLEQFLDDFDGGLERFFKVSGCKHELCKHTISPLEILTYLNANANIIATALDDPAPHKKNFNVYTYIESIDDASGFIQALDETDNKKALKIIREAVQRIQLDGIPIQPQSSTVSEDQEKVPQGTGKTESTAQPSDVHEAQQQKESPGPSTQSVPTISTNINESTHNGAFSPVQTSTTQPVDPVVSLVSNFRRDSLRKPSKEMSQDNTAATEYLYLQVDNGASVEDLIKSSLTEICQRSKNIVIFLTKLYELDAISNNERDEIRANSVNHGLTNAFTLIYDNLIKSNNGVALIEAWEASENYHIIQLCCAQQRQKDERRLSRIQIQPSYFDLTIPKNAGQPPQQQQSQQNLRTFDSDSSIDLDTTDFPRIPTPSTPSADRDTPNDSRNSSDLSLLHSSPTVHLQSQKYYSKSYSKSGTLETPLPLIKGQLIEKGVKTVHLNWVETKTKYLAQACQNCQDSLQNIKIENIIVIRPRRLKLRQQFGRVHCNCPNLKQFWISEAASLKIIRLTTLKSLMFFTPVNFHFDKSPTLCSVMKDCKLNLISYKKGGVTFIHIKKVQGVHDRHFKLVLRNLNFLKCEPFLKDAASVFSTFPFYFSFSAYGFESLDRSLDTFPKPEQVTALVLIKVSFTPGSEVLYKFVNLTKLIIHLNQPHENRTKSIDNHFEIDLCKLLRNTKNLERLVLRHVALVGNLSETDKQTMARLKSVMLYMCPLKKVDGILTDAEKVANVDWEDKLILKWENETGNKNLLVWDILNHVDNNLYFYTFQMRDFFENEVWNAKYAKYFVNANR